MVYTIVTLISMNIAFHWWRAKPEMSGLFMIILTEHFHASLLLVVGNSIQFY